MSRIDDLIKELSPKGVPIKSLRDIAELVRGNGMPKTDLADEGVGAIHYGQIYTRYGVWTTDTISFVTPEAATKLAKVEPGDIIITNTSENIEDVGKAVAWLGEKPIVTGGHATVIKHHQDPKFLSYWFQSESFFMQKKALATGTKVIDVSAKQLAKVRLPVPPLEVQQDIAQLLDLFSGLTADLATQLDAELETRRQQYQHLRRTILEGRIDGTQDVRLGDVADILVGFPFKSSEFASDLAAAALVRGDNIGQGFLKDRDFKRWRRAPGDSLEAYELRAGDIVLAMDRPWISAGLKWAYIAEDTLPALLVQRVARLRSDAKVLDQRFLGCIISSPAFTAHVLQNQTGNTVPHISAGQIEAFQFSLPTLPEQIRMAATIEDLNALTGNLMIDLTAERDARRKQYEYYRDRLLTFKELTA
jgi:type I restriction enzyme S subunit